RRLGGGRGLARVGERQERQIEGGRLVGAAWGAELEIRDLGQRQRRIGRLLDGLRRHGQGEHRGNRARGPAGGGGGGRGGGRGWGQAAGPARRSWARGRSADRAGSAWPCPGSRR